MGQHRIVLKANGIYPHYDFVDFQLLEDLVPSVFNQIAYIYTAWEIDSLQQTCCTTYLIFKCYSQCTWHFTDR